MTIARVLCWFGIHKWSRFPLGGWILCVRRGCYAGKKVKL